MRWVVNAFGRTSWANCGTTNLLRLWTHGKDGIVSLHFVQEQEMRFALRIAGNLSGNYYGRMWRNLIVSGSGLVLVTAISLRHVEMHYYKDDCCRGCVVAEVHIPHLHSQIHRFQHYHLYPSSPSVPVHARCLSTSHRGDRCRTVPLIPR